MPGVLNVLLAQAGIQIAPFGGTLDVLDNAPAYNAQASINLNTNGSISKVNIPALSSDTIGSQWPYAPFAAIGNFVWVKATLTSGSVPTAGTMGAWLSLAGAQTWGNTRTSIGLTTSTILLEFALDAAGVNPCGSASVILRAECA